MNIALWAVQVILFLIFFMAGWSKTFQYEKAKASMPWVKEYSPGFVKSIGRFELLGALGLILPGILRILPILTPIAAIGLSIIMILAAAFHYRRKEFSGIPMNIILLLFALFIAIGRFTIMPL